MRAVYMTMISISFLLLFFFLVNLFHKKEVFTP